MEKKIELIKCYPSWNEGTGTAPGAIFTDLKNAVGALSFGAYITANCGALDREYIGNRSGDKYPARIIQRLIAAHNPESDALTVVDRAQIVGMIVARFGDAWDRLYDALIADYNPIENYYMIETEKPKDNYKVSDTTVPSMDYAESDTRTSKSEIVVETDGDNDIYGFNSEAAVPSDKSHMKSTTSTDPTKNINTDVHTMEGTIAHERTQVGYMEHERSGNIGVTTSQQMIEQEIAIRQNQFSAQMMKDIDSVLTLPIYI